MKDKTIGFAVTGSFCTFKNVLPCMEELAKDNKVIPIFSYNVKNTDTRFYKAEDFTKKVTEITGNAPITTIVDAEPIGPKNLLDLLVIAPCTGNTLAKLNNAIIDTPVLMAAKAQLRNNKPVLIAVSTNDGLSGNAKNLGELLVKRNLYFVPFTQDDCVKKTHSLVADFTKLAEAADFAIEGKQMQPILCE